METPSGKVVPIHQSLLEWFQAQMAESGIPDNLIDQAEITPYLKEPVGYAIPYFDIRGVRVPDYIRVRVRNAPDKSDYRNRAPNAKYWQPRGLGQRLYWPKVGATDHVKNLSDIGCPLFITEGEKKAIALQAKLNGLGIVASVCSVPGVKLGKDLIRELLFHNHKLTAGKEILHRPVFLALDWNDKGAAEEDTRAAEDMLNHYLYDAGADVIILRWENPSAGVQKIDDYLVAGGDLQAALNYSTEHEGLSATVEVRKLLRYLNDHWALWNGLYVRTDGPQKGAVLSKSQFSNETAHMFIWDDSGKRPTKLYAHNLWTEWADKRTIDGFESHPPALGEEAERFVDGKLNVCSSWAPIPPAPEVAPWEESEPENLAEKYIERLLRNFCENEEQFTWLCQHIAHTLRYPQRTTSQVVILLDDHGGTGKSLLMDSFRRLSHPRMVGGLVKNYAIDSKDEFNKSLEGTVIAIVEEPERSSKGRDLEAILKRITGSATIEIRAMQKDRYSVRNFVHIFVAMNLRYLTPVKASDRRCNFFQGKESIKSPAEGGNGFGAEYGEFLRSDAFFRVWYDWVYSIDLSGYSPQVLGPVSTARIRAIGFSMSAEDEFFAKDCFKERAVWTVEQLRQLWMIDNPSKHITDTRMGLLCTQHWGDFQRTVKYKGKTIRLRAKEARFVDLPPQEWIAEFERLPDADKF